MLHDRKGKKSLLMFPTNRQQNTEKKGKRKRDREKNCTHTQLSCLIKVSFVFVQFSIIMIMKVRKICFFFQKMFLEKEN